MYREETEQQTHSRTKRLKPELSISNPVTQLPPVSPIIPDTKTSQTSFISARKRTRDQSTPTKTPIQTKIRTGMSPIHGNEHLTIQTEIGTGMSPIHGNEHDTDNPLPDRDTKTGILTPKSTPVKSQYYNTCGFISARRKPLQVIKYIYTLLFIYLISSSHIILQLLITNPCLLLRSLVYKYMLKLLV